MTASESIGSLASALAVLPVEIRDIIMRMPDKAKASIQEIRLRADRPLALSDGTTTVFINNKGMTVYSLNDSYSNVYVISRRIVEDVFRSICNYSVYSYDNEIKNGYITIRGGHRVGLCGTAVIKDGKISSLNDISSLNIRIARQIFGASKEIIQALYPFDRGALIVGAPSSGKTTVLKDLAYRLSLGVGCRIMRTAVIDERGEIAGVYRGTASNNTGLCDILNGYPKGEGIIHAIRALSPQVIICDELGTDEDVEAVSQGFNSGAVIIATLHASSYDELMKRSQAQRLINTGAFGNIVILASSDHPGKISEIISL